MECFERGRCFLEFGSILDKTFIPPQDIAGEPPDGPPYNTGQFAMGSLWSALLQDVARVPLRTTQDNLQWAVYGVL